MKKKVVIGLVEEALKNASFENAAFSVEIKEQTKLYRETWIIAPLEQALELLGEKVIEKKSKDNCGWSGGCTFELSCPCKHWKKRDGVEK